MSNPRNILFILNSLTFGGAEKLAVTLLNELDTSNLSLSLLYLRKKEAMLGELNQSRLNSVSCYDGTNSLEFRLPFYLARHIEREMIDTVVCINQRPMLYAFLARLFTRRKFEIIQALHVPRLVKRYQRLKNLLVYRPLFNRCARVIFVSEGQRRYWVSDGKIKPEKTKCIYNGVDVDHFKDTFSFEEKLEMRRMLGFAEKAFVVGSFARLHSGKNHTELIEALEAVRLTGIDANVLIAGDGPMRAILEEFIRSKGLEKHAVITGFQKDVRPLMSISDCIALTSRAESFPLCIIEGMSMGKPVISSRVTGTSEQIRHGETGFLYEPGNIGELAKFLRILSFPDHAAMMGKRARQVVCESFLLERMIEEYTGVLAETAASSPSTALGMRWSRG
jgi:glycosyltransferase involved in cell wall biosynthesis